MTRIVPAALASIAAFATVGSALGGQLDEANRCSADRVPDVAGTPGDDEIGPDQIHDGDLVFTYAGNDKVTVTSESVKVCGGDGADTLVAERGTSQAQFYGEAGSDDLHARERRQVSSLSFDGGRGPDHLGGSNHRDHLEGGPGGDELYGRISDDELYGGPDYDRLIGDDDADVLRGGGTSDRLYGGAGPDRMWGGAGDDSLSGYEGDDHANGNAGSDYCAAEYKENCERGRGGGVTHWRPDRRWRARFSLHSRPSPPPHRPPQAWSTASSATG